MPGFWLYRTHWIFFCVRFRVCHFRNTGWKKRSDAYWCVCMWFQLWICGPVCANWTSHKVCWHAAQLHFLPIMGSLAGQWCVSMKRFEFTRIQVSLQPGPLQTSYCKGSFRSPHLICLQPRDNLCEKKSHFLPSVNLPSVQLCQENWSQVTSAFLTVNLKEACSPEMDLTWTSKLMHRREQQSVKLAHQASFSWNRHDLWESNASPAAPSKTLLLWHLKTTHNAAFAKLLGAWSWSDTTWSSSLNGCQRNQWKIGHAGKHTHTSSWGFLNFTSPPIRQAEEKSSAEHQHQELTDVKVNERVRGRKAHECQYSDKQSHSRIFYLWKKKILSKTIMAIHHDFKSLSRTGKPIRQRALLRQCSCCDVELRKATREAPHKRSTFREDNGLDKHSTRHFTASTKKISINNTYTMRGQKKKKKKKLSSRCSWVDAQSHSYAIFTQTLQCIHRNRLKQGQATTEGTQPTLHNFSHKRGLAFSPDPISWLWIHFELMR